jgi:hypothetical protein
MLSALDEEFISRKEILQHKLDDYDFRQVAPDEYARSYLKLHSYQLTSAAFLDISTHHRSLHLQHAPGAGKTLSAITIASRYISRYNSIYAAERAKNTSTGYIARQELDRSTPSVFVLGFAGPKAAFIRDLLGNPEFGFITIAEKIQLATLARNAASGMEADKVAHRDFYNKIKRRITSKHSGGFFKFYGYEEFANRIFTGSGSRMLVEIESEAIRQHIAAEKTGEPPATIEELVNAAIAAGRLEVNRSFLSMLENSLLICDEIHNTYNMISKNNRGVAIQYALENVRSLRLLTMSATPINTSPTEIVELANYHLAANGEPTRLDRRALFSARRLKAGSLDVIERAFRGRISFIQDINLKYFPARIDVGKPYVLPADIEGFSAGAELPYLRFIECKMSEAHQAALNSATDEAAEAEDLIEYADMLSQQSPYRSIPPDGYSIFDLVFPNPAGGTMFRSSELRRVLLSGNSPEIHARRSSIKGDTLVISGSFLERKNIEKYCTKAAKLLDILSEIIKSSGGDPERTARVMIYHDRVAGNGVLFYQELLIANGFVDEYGEPIASTLCMVCGETANKHGGSGCNFIPARFVCAHSMIEKSTMEDSIAKFNSPDNLYGHSYMILLGSRIIKESYDFKAVRHQIIMSVVSSIPTMLQINGRCIRKESHAGLPQDLWKVHIYILLSTVDKDYPHKDLVSPEVYRYAAKLRDYLEIQKIDQRTNSVAFDGSIHRKIIMPDAMTARYFPNGNGPVDVFGNLYFEPKILPATRTDTTFRAYKYWEEEVKTITYVIKRLFIIRPVWKYEELWEATRHPPINLEVNPAMFLEDNFIIALSSLVYSGTPQIPLDLRKGKAFDSAYYNHPSTIMARLLDSHDKYIYKSSRRMKIGKVGEYYILSPVADITIKPINAYIPEYSERIRNEEVQVMRSAVEIGTTPIIDIETYSRSIGDRQGVHVDISSYIRSANIELNHQEYVAKLAKDPTPLNFIYDCPYETAVYIIEERIKGGMPQFDEIFAFLQRVGALVMSSEIRKYKDVAKLLPPLEGEKPVGYCRKKSVNIYDGKEWIEVNKIALNRQITYKENPIIIGYITPGIENKFKIRLPVDKIREKVQNIKSRKSHLSLVNVLGKDTRTIEKGVVCTTKGKVQLVSILSQLGVDFSKSRNATVNKMCSGLKKILLEKEEKQRVAGTREKWLYFPWDEEPRIY